jgi:hypothetical protein
MIANTNEEGELDIVDNLVRSKRALDENFLWRKRMKYDLVMEIGRK